MAVYRDGVLYVDNSTLATLATCATKAMIRYGYNLKPAGWTGAALKAGTAIHKAIEAHYTGEPLSKALNAFEAEYKEWAITHVAIDDRLSYNNVRECIESWILRNPLAKLPYLIPTPEHVEMPFDLQLHPKDPTIRYVGSIDALVARRAGRTVDSPHIDRDALYVLDTKSSGQPYGNWFRQFDLSPQFTGYTWAANQLFPEARVVGIYVNVVHVYQIPREGGRCSIHKVNKSECRFMHPKHTLEGPYLRSQQELTQWRADAYLLAKRWKDLLDTQHEGRNLSLVPQDGKWVYQACNFCELHEFCRAGRNLNNFEFEIEEWIPGDLATRS